MSEQGDSFGAEFHAFRGALSPMAVSGAIRQMLGLCWMLLPPEQQNLEGIHVQATEFFERALDWWGAVGDLDPETMSQRLGDDLEIQKVPLKIEDVAEHSMRQALFCCSLLLPEEKRSSVAVARMVGEILQRNLAQVEEDFRMFEAE